MNINKVTIIGAGTMGNGIAHVFALNGFSVDLIDVSDNILNEAKNKINANLERQIKKDITIPTRKKNIRDFFEERFQTRSIGRGSGKLIIEADESNIQKSFPGLTFILNAIEKQCSENN